MLYSRAALLCCCGAHFQSCLRQHCDADAGYVSAAVHLLVGDNTYHAHSQCLAAESGILEKALQDIEPMPTAKQPWVIESLLQGYDSKVVEKLLGAVYSPPVTYDTETAWEMLDIADHLECKRMLKVLRASLESCGGKSGTPACNAYCGHCVSL